jgi:RNA polymerase sigma factor (sigma-70 family)
VPVFGQSEQYFDGSSVYASMLQALTAPTLADQDRALSGTFAREARRLRGFIRRRVADVADADDILQDVFSELIEATRLATPIEHVGAWLFRVATNRITDRFRRKRLPLAAAIGAGRGTDSDEAIDADPPATAPGPEARYESRLLLADLEAALAELPAAQREVFLAHELEGRSFKNLAAESGTSINTLLARKRYAVLHLRQKLQQHHDHDI